MHISREASCVVQMLCGYWTCCSLQCYLNATLTRLDQLHSCAEGHLGTIQDAVQRLGHQTALDVLESAKWKPFLRAWRRPSQQHDVTGLLRRFLPHLHGSLAHQTLHSNESGQLCYFEMSGSSLRRHSCTRTCTSLAAYRPCQVCVPTMTGSEAQTVNSRCKNH